MHRLRRGQCRAAVRAAGRNHETLPAVPRDSNAETPEQVQVIDVRSGNHSPSTSDHNIYQPPPAAAPAKARSGTGSRHRRGPGWLAEVSGHALRSAAAAKPSCRGSRSNAELPQRVDQIADRPLVHAVDAASRSGRLASPRARRARQPAGIAVRHCRGIARPREMQATTEAGDADLRFLGLHRATQLAKRGLHDLRVVESRGPSARSCRCSRGQQQQSVRNALEQVSNIAAGPGEGGRSRKRVVYMRSSSTPSVRLRLVCGFDAFICSRCARPTRFGSAPRALRCSRW